MSHRNPEFNFSCETDLLGLPTPGSLLPSYVQPVPVGTKGQSVASAAVTMVTSEQLSLVSFYREGSTCLAFPEAHSARPSRKHYPRDPADPRGSGIWQPVSASGATCFGHSLGSIPSCHGASTALNPWDLLSPHNPRRPCLSASSGWRQQPGVGWGGG